jgi:hypothetical protein
MDVPLGEMIGSFDVGKFEGDPVFVSVGDYPATEIECHNGNDERADHVGPHHPPETHSAAEYGYYLRMLRKPRRHKNDGYKHGDGRDHVGHIRHIIHIIAKDLAGSELIFDKILIVVSEVDKHHDNLNDENHKGIRRQKIF